MRRWIYTQGGEPLPEPIEVGDDAPDEVLGIQKSTGDLGKFEYEAAGRTIDGVDISSKTKLNAHLKRTGTCLMHELKGDFEKAEKQREAIREGRHDTRARREDIGRAIYQLEKRGRK